MKKIVNGLLCLSLITSGYLVAYAEPKKTESESNTVFLSTHAQKMAGIEVTRIEPQALPHLVSAPGEVIPNADLTTKVSTRVAAQVLQRYIQEGELIKKGQTLLRLSSVDMAKTQSDLLLSWQEWKRVQALGKDAVSGKRFSAARVTYQNAYATAMAYGMTATEIENLLRFEKPINANGDFKLFASRDGTVFNINFTEGELVEAGRILLDIVDEKTVWVDARLHPNQSTPVAVGETVVINVNDKTLSGRVIQVHHQLDEITRTRSIRLEVPNTDDALHPGQFVQCQIEVGKTAPLLAIPSDALSKNSDGDWVIYIEKASGQFQQREVKMREIIENQAVIEGVEPGDRVVTQGAFFIHAELSKKGFDAHGD